MTVFGSMLRAMALAPGSRKLDVIEGRWPQDISGYSYVVGPAPTPGIAYFQAPGMVHRLNLTANRDETLTWDNNFILSEGFQVMGQLPLEARKNMGLMLMMGIVGNAANTALVPMDNGRMLATFDVGRPVEIDPINLRFVSNVGYLREWKIWMPGAVQPTVQTPAHPYYDPFEKTLYTINYASAPKGGTSLTENELDMWVARWDTAGKVERWHVSNVTFTNYIHESLATRNFVIWHDSAVYPTEPGERYGLPRRRPQLSYTDVAIVRKRDLQASVSEVKATVVRIPLESGHIIADYDDDGQFLTLYCAHANSTELPMTVRPKDNNYFTGQPVDPGAVGAYTLCDATPFGKYIINVETGQLEKSQLVLEPEKLWGLSLQARDLRPDALHLNRDAYMSYLGFDPANVTERMMNLYANHPYRIVPADKLPTKPVPSALTHVDMSTMETVERYIFEPGLVNSSPTWIPDHHNGAGYVLTQVWSEHDPMQVWLFAADKLAAGPVAKLAHPELRLPFTVHTAWLPELQPRTSYYQVDFAEDIGTDYQLLPDFVREAVENVIKQSRNIN